MAAELKEVTPSFYAKSSKKYISISATKCEKDFVSKKIASPFIMLRCAFYQLWHMTIYCWLVLKSCYRSCILHVSRNTWTVSMHSQNIDPVEILLSRAVKCLIMCKEQPTLIKETEKWKKHRVPCIKKKNWGKSTGNIYWAPSKRRDNANQWLGQVQQKELNKLEKTKNQLDFTKLNTVS